MDAWLRDPARGDQSQHAGGRERRRATHAGEAGRRVEFVVQRPGHAHVAAAARAPRAHGHHRDVGLAFLVRPVREEQLRGQVDRAHARVAHLHVFVREEPQVAERAHELGVARPAHGLLAHVRHLERVRQAAQPVGVEGLERAHARQRDELRIAQRLADHDLAVLHHARRTHVLLDDVMVAERRLVLPRPVPRAREAADQDLDRVAAVERARGPAGQHVAHAGCHAAVGDHGNAGAARGAVVLAEVLRHERDVDVRHALGDDRGHHLETEAARQRAEHQVRLQATDERAHLARPAGVVHDEPCVRAHRRPGGRARTGNCASSRARHRGRHAALGSLDRGCARVDHGDMEPGRRGEVGRGNASHHAGAEDEDVHRNAPCGIWRVAGARLVRQAPSRVITWCSSRSPRPRSG